MSPTHPLLARLLRKVGASAEAPPSGDAWRQLLELIARTYQDNDQDRYTLERSIDISSREMQRLYNDLKNRSETELDETHAVLHETLEAAAEGVLVVDKDRHVIAMNRTFTELTQLPAELIAAGDHRALIEASVRNFKDPHTALARIEELHGSDAIGRDELETVDGRIIERYSAPVRRSDGERVGRVTFMRDITAERAHRHELHRAREAAEAASHAKSMFLANMSHELRTPLNAVIGLADLLLLPGGDPVTPRQQEYLEGIVQSGRHLLAMVNDVLDLAKIEAGKQVLELEHVGASDAISEAVAVLQPVATSRGVQLVAQIEPHTPPLMADPVRLRQILYNLISNAVKFTDRDGHVTVSARQDSRGVAIKVSDTGIGIAPEDMTRLFRAFEQIALPSGDRPGGTGLGLALTKRLVDMHGGTIDVASRPGAGTTFTVRLPVA